MNFPAPKVRTEASGQNVESVASSEKVNPSVESKQKEIKE